MLGGNAIGAAGAPLKIVFFFDCAASEEASASARNTGAPNESIKRKCDKTGFEWLRQRVDFIDSECDLELRVIHEFA